jgi:signal transduction histidine kinase
VNRGSLRLRLLLASAISILGAVLLSAVGLALLFQHHVERRVDAELATYLDQVVANLGRSAEGALVLRRRPADPRFAEPLSGLYWELSTGDKVLRSRSLWDERLALPDDRIHDGVVHRHRIAGPGGAKLLVLERSIALPEALGGGMLRASVAVDTAAITRARREFVADLAPYLLLIAGLLLLAAYVQVRFGLKPLVAVRDRLAAIREGRARRLGENFPDEILPLAEQVDALLQARDEEVERVRARAADLAHGLKTPLQVLAGDIEALRARGEGEIAAEIEQVATMMSRHVDRELARARMVAGRGDARARPAEVIARVIAVVRRTPDGGLRQWSVDVPADLVARIDPDDLAEAVGSLVENAARHANSRVAVSAVRSGHRVRLSIVDDGPGIPAGRLEEALARGGRLDRAGEGTGLGLAIARDVAEAWGGSLELRSLDPGLEASIVLDA